MKKGCKEKCAVILGAAVAAGAAYQAYRKIRNAHHNLTRRSGEELLGKKPGEDVWDSYPRPHMRRESFISLNGQWKLNGKDILVPFPPQALLSGYRGRVGTRLAYSRTFVRPAVRKGERILLHFGAVDQVAEVFLNGRCVGKHEGGYLPFCFDVTRYLKPGENCLLVKVKDTLSPRYPYGKQRRRRGGMWYTPVSGIWQSVWLECVPNVYMKKLEVKTDGYRVSVTVENSVWCDLSVGENLCGEEDPISVTIALHDGSSCTFQGRGNRAEIDMTQVRLADGSFYEPVLWTPENPYLYQMTVTLGKDRVSSYFGLRTVEVMEVDGVPRVCLNGEPIFLNGVLDQGYFCDGIYLPAREEEFEQDILRMKDLGINMLRKHMKVEPECFYYYCDKHGMLVMQDMVNSGVYSWIRDTALPTLGVFQKWDGRFWGSRKRREFFVEHMKETQSHLMNHPSVIAYTIFNEGWGQFESAAMYWRAKCVDDTRLYDSASGWFVQNRSDFDSQHIYFHSLKLPEVLEKPVLVSECGGYTWAVPGHFYTKYAKYGYGKCRDRQELTNRVKELYEGTILPGVSRGVCGCVYTQLSDVEDETNGFYTYDRKVCKVDPGVMREIAARLKAAVALRKEGEN